MRKFRDLDEREVATILAALRRWQTFPAHMQGSSYFDNCEPLDDEEIDTLCESINYGDIKLRVQIS